MNRITHRIFAEALVPTVILLFGLIAFASGSLGQPSTFATDVGRPQTLVRTPDGDYLVVDTDAKIRSLPATGGTSTVVASTTWGLRDGVFLPKSFGTIAGQFMVVGGQATTNTPAFAYLADDVFSVSQYATQPGSLWSSSIVPTGFGQYTLGVLVLNQGSGQGLRNGSLDYFDPDGTVSRVADLPQIRVPYAAVQAFGFGSESGKVVVSDAQSGDIISVHQTGDVQPFATVPLATGQTGLRQMAFAPNGWGEYSNHLFVSITAREVAVVNSSGNVVGKIAGMIAPRGLLFAKVNSIPSLLICDTGNQPASNPNGKVWIASLTDIVPVP